jgi:uncharacterized membrane protein YwaF
MTTFLVFLAALVFAEAISASLSQSGLSGWVRVLILVLIGIGCLFIAGAIGPLVVSGS